MDKKDHNDKFDEKNGEDQINNDNPLFSEDDKSTHNLEGLDEHDLDAMDFSFVHDSFEQNFIKASPPKFSWDNIEQELEALEMT